METDMTLEQYALLGEIAAAVGVVVSLAYVARQLGQNTAMMRRAAASERLERDYDIAAPVIQSRELAEIWTKGESDFASLDAVDQHRLMFFERRAIGLWYHLFHLRREKVLSDADWHEHVWIMRNLGRRQAIRETWQVFEEAYEPSFREFLTHQFAIADNAILGNGAASLDPEA